ncbi:hypothetical protein BDF14DRAFT_1884560 [Spinellus fusiger]|nr:hypothetical protein BDF14DRAFT_1884560 [Spinellus fusiger]
MVYLLGVAITLLDSVKNFLNRAQLTLLILRTSNDHRRLKVLCLLSMMCSHRTTTALSRE